MNQQGAPSGLHNFSKRAAPLVLLSFVLLTPFQAVAKTAASEVPPKEAAPKATLSATEAQAQIQAQAIVSADNQISPFLRDGESTNLQNPGDSSSGAFTYQYPFELAPGRLGLTPSLGLTYSSQRHRQDDLFGYGWDITIPSIERVNYEGIEDLYTNTRSRFTSSLSGELATTTVSGAYVAQDDNGSYMRYVFANNAWTVTDKMGTTYTFGSTTASRQDDPASSSRVYKWMLQEVKDTNGNTVTYTYTKNAGQIYPTTITYGGNGVTAGPFVVNFGLAPRAQPAATTTDAGFPVQTRYLISQVTEKVDTAFVRKYTFTYGVGSNGTQQLLTAIQMTGYDEKQVASTLPATQFTYSTPSLEWDTNNWNIPFKFVSDWRDYGGALADITGDGLTDIVRGERRESGAISQNRVYVASLSGWNNLSNVIQVPCALTERENDDTNNQKDAGTRILDVNGDYLPDFVCNDEETFLNTGDYNNQWRESSVWRSPEGLVYSSGRDRGIQFPDLNGDGLPDLIRSTLTGSNTIVSAYLNTGSGWISSSSWRTALENTDIIFSASDLHDTGARVADVNGDGLDDLISGDDDEYADETNAVYLNTGSGFVEHPEWEVPEPAGRVDTRLFDFNSDGLVDIVSSGDITTGGHDEDNVYLNTGGGWVLTKIEAPEFFTINEQDAGTRIGEFNGDGIPDFVSYGDGTGIKDWDNEEVWISKGSPADLLVYIREPYGGTVAPIYKGSPSYTLPNTDRYKDFPPFNVMTVNAIQKSNGITGTTTETYDYSHGEYYYKGPFDRQFAGFGRVYAKDALGNETQTYFHQGNESDTGRGEYQDERAKIGKPFSIDVLNTTGNIFKRTVRQWVSKLIPGSSTGRFVLLNRSTELDYDGNTTHNDRSSMYTYDAIGNVQQARDYGQVKAIDDGSFTDTGTDRVFESYLYAANPASKVTGKVSQASTTDQAGVKLRETRYYYDASPVLGAISKGNLTKQESWITGLGYASTTRLYNAYGLVTRDTDARGNATNYTYDKYNLYVATSTNALLQKDTFTYDYSSGKVRSHTDPNGLTNATTFDGLDRVTAELIPDVANFRTLVPRYTISYVNGSLPSATRTDYLDASKSVQTITYFNRFLKPIQERRKAEDANVYVVTDKVYDKRGLLERESLPYFSNGAARTSSTGVSALLKRYTYDPIGRVKTLITVDGTTSYAYDQWTTTTTDTLGKIRAHITDARGNLTQVNEVNSGSTYQTLYTWDGVGNLTKIRDAALNVRSFVYDGLSRLVSAEDLHAPADTEFGVWKYAYDLAGNLTRSTSPRGKVVDYTYDSLNRVRTENSSDTAYTDFTYGYDQSFHFGIGHVSSVSSGSIGSAFDYDQNGNLWAEQHVIPGTATTTTYYYYTRRGDVQSVIYPDSSYIYNTYNAGGQLEYIQLLENATSTWSTIVADFDYAPTGQLIYTLYGNSSVTENVLDAANNYRLKSKQSWSATDIFQNLGYTYDKAGNLRTLTEATWPAARQVGYTYDDLYRLTIASTTSPFGASYKQTFSYNAIGNMAARTGTSYLYQGNAAGNYANPHAATKIGSATLTYDRDGNLLSDATTSYQWDYRGQLVRTDAKIGAATTTTTYAYNQDGQRIKKTVTGQGMYTYPNKYSSTLGARGYKYIFGSEGQVATVETIGTKDTISYTYLDHLGSTNVVADSKGQTIETLDYYPFGAVRLDVASSTLPIPEQHKYIGQFYDPSSKLSYLNARYYDGNDSQFTSQDPVFWGKQNLTNPQSLNSYSYTENNPINRLDPSGLSSADTEAAKLNAIQDGINKAKSDLRQLAYSFAFVLPKNIADATLDPFSGYQTAINPNESLASRTGARVGIAFGIFGSILTPELRAVTSAPRLLNPSILISEERMTHIIARHTIEGAQNTAASIFNNAAEIRQLISLGTQQPITKQVFGDNFQRVFDVGRSIGTYMRTGEQTSILTIITDASSNLITSFPGLP